MSVEDSEELVDGEPSPCAPSGAAGARRSEIEVESDVTMLLLHKDSALSNNKRTWVTCVGRVLEVNLDREEGRSEKRGSRHTGLTEG